tara:strand:+ start:123 stop:371 length:249 start_codon:yes stop_codon:yes gene_type:complete
MENNKRLKVFFPYFYQLKEIAVFTRTSKQDKWQSRAGAFLNSTKRQVSDLSHWHSTVLWRVLFVSNSCPSELTGIALGEVIR